MKGHAVPLGLVGIETRPAIAVHVKVGIKSAKSGAPVLKDRFWLMTPQAASKEYAGSGRTFRALTRDFDPAFAAWNDMAKGPSGDGKVRDPRSAVLRGNIVHSEIGDAVMWNRSAHKLSEPHPNPPSQAPACEGNGIWARRFSRVENGREVFEEIPCPNEACVFAQAGLCKVFASMIFLLRWDRDDPFERQFDSVLATWSTRGIHSAMNLLGLFEYVLGTDAVLPREPNENSERPEDWKPGLAAEMGIDRPSLFGMPFMMKIGEKTSSKGDGRRYPVVSFSPDGDLMAWLIRQKEQRELVGGLQRALPAYASVKDPEYLNEIRHVERQELDVVAIEEPAAPKAPEPAPIPPPVEAAPPPSAEPAMLSPAKVESLAKLAAERGIEPEALSAECVRLAGTGSLAGLLAVHEADVLKFIEQNSKRRKR